MALTILNSELPFDNVLAGNPISVAIQVYDTAHVFVTYGLARHNATEGTDYTIELDESNNFRDCIVTPTVALTTKLTVMVTGNPDEVNRIYIKRVLPSTNDFVETDGFVRRKIVTEIDMVLMRIQQLSGDVIASVAGQLQFDPPVTGQFLVWDADGQVTSVAVVLPVGAYTIASMLEAQIGTRNDVLMTPLRVKQAANQDAPYFFDNKVLAEAFIAPNGVYPSAIQLRGHTANGDGSPGLFVDKGTAPAHALTLHVGTKTYERVPATVHSPANIYEVGVDPSDATPGINRMLAAWKESGFNDWYMPGGYVCNQRPNDIDSRLSPDQSDAQYTFHVKGQGAYRSTIWKNFQSSGTADGIFNIRQNDVQIQDLQLVSLVGSQIAGLGSGCLISAVAPAHSIGYCSIRDIDISSGGGTGNAFHYTGLYFDGRYGTTSGDLGFGIRGYEILNAKIFGGEIAAAIFNNCTSLTWIGGDTFAAGGNSGAIIFNGTDKDVPPAWNNAVSYINGNMVASAGLYYRCKVNNINAIPAANLDKWDAQLLRTGGCVSSKVVVGTLTGGVSFSNSHGCSVDAADFQAGSIAFDALSTGCRTRGGDVGLIGVNNLGVGCYHNGTNIDKIDAYSGWIKHEDGTVEQWMRVLTTNGSAFYAFPIPFPVECFACPITPEGLAASDQSSIASGGFTNLGVSIVSTGSVFVYVYAKGR